MPVIDSKQLRDNPELSEFSSFGVFKLKRGDTTEPHYHDCDEWWIITQGHALIATEGEEHEVERGHMIFTPSGEEHEVKEVYRALEGVYIEGPLVGKKRRGHLHHPEDD
jgi:mannose-6-phosphate isomerase-like protein (cupin superfamily)